VKVAVLLFQQNFLLLIVSYDTIKTNNNYSLYSK